MTTVVGEFLPSMSTLIMQSSSVKNVYYVKNYKFVRYNYGKKGVNNRQTQETLKLQAKSV